MRIVFFFVFIILIISCKTKPSPDSIDLDTIFDSIFKADEPGGAVLIAKDGKVIYEKRIWRRRYYYKKTDRH